MIPCDNSIEELSVYADWLLDEGRDAESDWVRQSLGSMRVGASVTDTPGSNCVGWNLDLRNMYFSFEDNVGNARVWSDGPIFFGDDWIGGDPTGGTYHMVVGGTAHSNIGVHDHF